MKIIDVPKSILDLLAMAEHGTAEWGRPEELDHSLPMLYWRHCL